MSDQANIQIIRARNIESREKKAKREQARLEKKLRRSEKKTLSSNDFAERYAARRALYVEKRIAQINRRYDRKVANVGCPFLLRGLRLQKAIIDRYIERKKSKLVSSGAAPHTDSTDLHQVHEVRSQNVAGLVGRIDSLSAAARQKIEQKEESARSRAQSDLRIKYYKLRLKYLGYIFRLKHNRVSKKLETAAISERVGEEREKRIQIDEATSYLRWDKKIADLNERYQLGNTKLIIRRLEESRAAELRSIKKRAEMPPAFTVISSARDIFEIAKSNYVAGHEIRSIINRTANHLRKFSMYYIFAIIIIAFGAATSWKNLDSDNIADVIQSNIYILIIGLGMLLVIVSGAIDLSVGSLVTFSGVLSVYSYNQFGGNLGISIVVTLLFGLGYGLFQGFLIGYFKMPSFVVTLGGMLLFSGLALVVTNGQTLQPLGTNAEAFKYWVNGSFETANTGGISLFHYASFLIIFSLGIVVAFLMFFGRLKRVKYGIDTGSFLSFMLKIVVVLGLFAVVAYFIADSIFGIKYYMIYLLVLIVLITFVTQNTTFGRAVYAIGGNKRAAFLSGINVARTQTLVFGIVGILSAFAGLVLSGINNYATASIGSGYELDVISSVFVGGASMTGGIGTVAGTIIGGMALGFIQNGLLLLNFADAIQKVVKAVILIAAVGYDVYNHRKIG